MRLIDADKLIEYIMGAENRRADSMQWERYAEIVSNQPTAYDVDKVVEELKRDSMPYMGDPNDRDVDLGRAIAIAKAGGVNE